MENIRKHCYFFFQTGPPTARYGKNLGQAKKRYKEEKKILTFRLTRDHLRHLFALIKCLLLSPYQIWSSSLPPEGSFGTHGLRIILLTNFLSSRTQIHKSLLSHRHDGFGKVSFFVQCTKMQLITLQNFNIHTFFSQFLWFFSLKCWFKGQIISIIHLSLPDVFLLKYQWK